MATYADTTAVDDLIPAAVASRDDYATLAAECEADLFARYTRRTPYRGYGWYGWFPHVPWGEVGTEGLLSADETRAVYLRYYRADAADVDGDDADEAAFLAAVKLDLAALILWRAQQRDASGTHAAVVASESRGRRSVSYREGGAGSLTQTYPPGFGRHLRPFDLRPPVYGA